MTGQPSPKNIQDVLQLVSSAVRHLHDYVDQVSPGPLPTQFYRDIADGFNSVEDRIHVFLSRHGCAIALCDLLVNQSRGLGGVTPRGWPTGTTYELCSAHYDVTQSLVEVAAFIRDPVVGLMPSQLMDAAVREELGHAVDHALSWVSHSPTFLAAYRADAASVTSQQAVSLAYYLDRTHGGGQHDERAAAEEVFSALFAVRFGGNSDLPSLQRVLVSVFTACQRELDQHLSGIT